jgi:hypothetical protein
VKFPFANDVERVHSVVLQNIYIMPQHESFPTALNTLHNLKNGTYRDMYPVIESNHPYIVLPEEVCEEIARHVGAQYDEESGHYLLSNQSYRQLQTKSTSLIFQITSPQSSQHVKISLPSTSLALRLDYPLRKTISNSSWYIPIQHAENERQLALGRAFLQNSVLISDYERSTFYVQEAVPAFPRYKSEIRPILLNKRSTLDSWDTGLSRGAIAGISAGIVSLVVLSGLTALCLRYRNKKGEETSSNDPFWSSSTLLNPFPPEADSAPIQELGDSNLNHRTELETEPAIAELPGNIFTRSWIGFSESSVGVAELADTQKGPRGL